MSTNKVLAIVEGKEITQENLDFILKNIDPQQAMQFYSEDGQERLLEELINQELFYLDALEKGFDQDETYKKDVERVTADILKQYALVKLFSTINIDEKEIEEYYNLHKNLFKIKDSVSACHILVEEKEEADTILKEINAGLEFEEAAKKYSKCPSSSKGGDLGFFSEGQMVPPFEQAAFNMQVGEISQPIQTQFGYHLIKVNDKKAAGFRPLDEEVKEQIKNVLTSKKQNELYINKSEELRNKYEIKIV